METKKLNEAGETVFGGTEGVNGFNPGGSLGKWFSRFFASQSKPYIAQQAQEDQPFQKDSLAGDTHTHLDTLKVKVDNSFPGPSIVRNIYTPEYERTRKERYKQYEKMDEYPEISSAFDIFADDATQKDIKGRRWIIETDSPIVKKEVETLFKTIDLERYYWDIIRNTVKYGDCFVEIIVDENNPKAGVQRIKILNPNYILRIENIYGYNTGFLQEIPERADFSAFGLQSEMMKKSQFISLDKNQIIHFRLSSSDPKHYPYGKSMAASVIRVFRSLLLMEDAVLVYRLTRSPERRVFYINIGNTPTTKVNALMEKMKAKLKKEKFYNQSTGNIDERYSPLAMDEDIFIPHRGKDTETKIDTLPGAENLGVIEDLNYFKDKVLAGMKIPRDYVIESKDKGPERKANLSQLDVKFAKTVMRVQQHAIFGFQSLVRRHLKIRGVPQHLINELKLRLPDPSDMFTKRKLEIDEAKTRVVAAVAGLQSMGKPLFSAETIYKEYFEMDDIEIEKETDRIEKAQEEMAMMNPMGDPNGMPGQPGMPGDSNAQSSENPTAPDQNTPEVGGRAGLIKQKQPGSAGMDSPQNEEVKYLNKILLKESNPKRIKTLKRIREKLNLTKSN